MEDVLILAIETSCDDTSIALVRNGKEVLANKISSQIAIHNQTGGVIPEIASRQHCDNILYVLEEVLKTSGTKLHQIDAVAVTAGPGLVGSLLVGIEVAKTISLLMSKPLIGVHHIKGHIYANYIENDFDFPIVSLVVSGGHTEIVLQTNHYEFKRLYSTSDDAIGECYDKVARILNLEYPGGPIIDRLAKSGQFIEDIKYTYTKNESFTYSGLKSAVINYVNTAKMKDQEVNAADVAFTFQEYAIFQLLDKLVDAINLYNPNQVFLCGGVAANSRLRELVSKQNVAVFYPQMQYCTDNAVMVAAYAYFQYLKNDFSDLNLNANPNLKM